MDSKEVRKQRIRDAKTKIILDAALHVIAKKGYHETRLEDIGEEAGFSKSALYRYYKDKDEIFISIAVREKNKVIDKLLSSDSEYGLDETLHIHENLSRLLKVSLSAWGEYFSFILALDSFQFHAIITALRSQKKLLEIEKKFLYCEKKMDEIMIAMFDRAKEKGEITTSLKSEVLFEFFQGFLFTRIKKWHQEKKMGDIDETIDEILMFSEMGMGMKRKLREKREEREDG